MTVRQWWQTRRQQVSARVSRLVRMAPSSSLVLRTAVVAGVMEEAVLKQLRSFEVGYP